MFSWLAFGCENKPISMDDYFNNRAVRLKSTRVNGFGSLLKNPTSMTLADSFFVFSDNYDGLRFSVCDISQPRLITRFGRTGRGPNEFTVISNSQYNRQKDLFHFYALNEQKWLSYSLHKVVADTSYVPQIYQLQTSKNFGFLYSVIPMNDELFIGSGWFNNGKYAIVTKDGFQKKIFGTNKIDPELQSIDEYTLNDIFQGRIKKHPNTRKIAYASIGCDLIEVIDLSQIDNPIITQRYTYIPMIDKSHNPYKTSRDNPFGYAAFDVTDKYIYVIYSGKNLKKGIRFLQEGDILYVFDWQLNPIKAYKLDFEVSFIAVAENDKQIFSAVSIDDKIELVSWTMNH